MREKLEQVIRDAVRLAITRHDLEWDKDTEWTEESIAEDAVHACFGESGCSDELLPSVKAILTIAANNGRKGGKSKSRAKTSAARKNGKKGGRPRKEEQADGQ